MENNTPVKVVSTTSGSPAKGNSKDKKSKPRGRGKAKAKPAKVEQPVQVAPVEPPVPPAPSSWGARARAIPVPVGPGSKEEDYCSRNNYAAVVTEGLGYNPHGIGAVNRRKCVFYVLGAAADAGCKSLCDLWGSDRTKRFAAQLTGYPATIRVVGAHEAPADMTRRPKPDAPAPADTLMMVNVYQCGNEPFTPAKAASLLSEYGAERLYWIGHRFPEAVGDTDVVGAYKRVYGDRVVARASPQDRVYGPHSAVSWMLADGCASGVAWSNIASYGDCHVYMLVASKMALREEKTPAQLAWSEVDVLDYRDWWTGTFGEYFPNWVLPYVAPLLGFKRRTGVVARALVSIGREHTRAVKLNQNVLRQVTSAIQRAVKNKPYSTVIAAFPEVEQELIDMAVIATLVESVEEDLPLLQSFNAAHGANVVVRSTEMNAFGKAKAATHRIFWVLAALAASRWAREICRAALSLLLRFLRWWLDSPFTWIKAYPKLSVFLEEALRGPLYQLFGFLFAVGIMKVVPNPQNSIGGLMLWNWASTIFGGLHALGFGLLDTKFHGGVPLIKKTAFHYFMLEVDNVVNNAIHHAFPSFKYPSLTTTACRMVVHHAINRWTSSSAKPVASASAWEHFRDNYLEAPSNDLVAMEDQQVRYTPMPPHDLRVRDSTDKPVSPDPPESIFTKGKGVEQLIDAPPHESYHYAVMPVNAPWFVPGTAGVTSYYAVKRRVLRQTPLETLPTKATDREGRARELLKLYTRNWRRANSTLVANLSRCVDAVPKALSAPIQAEEARQAWFEHLRGKHNEARLRTAMEKNDEWDVPAAPIKMNLKRNEKLFKRSDAGIMDRLARTIAAVRPEEVAYAGPYVYEATQRLKKVFPVDWQNSTPFILRDGLPMYVILGPMTDVEMSTAATQAARSAREQLLLFVSGDDSLILAYHTKVGWFAIEGDFSMFDQSQFKESQKGPLEILRALGTPERIITLMKAETTSSLVHTVPHSGITAVIKTPQGQRKTGSVLTSTGNSGVTITSWTDVLNEVGGLSALADAILSSQAEKLLTEGFQRLGLKIKLRVTRSDNGHPFVGATFLKHVLMPGFCDGEELGLLACPLPSKFNKIGVSLRHPSEIYDLPIEEAGPRFLRDQALGIKDAWLLPPLHAFVGRHLSDVEESEVSSLIDPEDAYRITVSTGPFMGRPKSAWSPRGVMQWGLARYGEAWRDYPSIELLLTAAPAMVFLEHPLFEAMARADYA
jgi:alkylated DNA nucleotide flippase Atl1